MIKINNILCAVDFSEVSIKVASYARTLAKALNARVHVIHVAPGRDMELDVDVPQSSLKSFINEIETGIHDNMMKKFIQENFSAVDAAGIVSTGDASEEIINFARNENIDLLVMGTHGRRGVDKILFGSVAEKVVKASKIPVVTIRPDQAGK